MSTTNFEKRLAAIEHQLARLKLDRGSTAPMRPIDALEKIHGTFENDEAFQEAMRLGRKWRESQRPATRKSKGKRK